MAQDQKGAKEVLNARKNELSVVAQDQNWRSYVANELKCADMWQNDWGFLGGQGAGKYTVWFRIINSRDWNVRTPYEVH